MSKLKFELQGFSRQKMQVYDDKVIIFSGFTFESIVESAFKSTKKFKFELGSIIDNSIVAEQKTVFFSDVIGIEFRKSSNLSDGVLILETAASSCSNNFCYNGNRNTSNDTMTKVVAYIQERVEYFKNLKNNSAGSISPVEEIKKMKELLDMGIITQAEFDAKKKQLLGV